MSMQKKQSRRNTIGSGDPQGAYGRHSTPRQCGPQTEGKREVLPLLSREELQAALMAFADSFAAWFYEALTELESSL